MEVGTIMKGVWPAFIGHLQDVGDLYVQVPDTAWLKTISWSQMSGSRPPAMIGRPCWMTRDTKVEQSSSSWGQDCHHCQLAPLHLWVLGQAVTVPGPPQARGQGVQGVLEQEELDRLLDGGLAAGAGHHLLLRGGTLAATCPGGLQG